MFVSIFNDVIGPVMRGPSSSHCAAALRIGRIARDLLGGQIESVLIEFDRSGSLPTTHDSQGSDMGLFGGLMGWEAADERLPNSMEIFQQQGSAIRFETIDCGDPHPNTYRLTLTNSHEQHSLIAISTGGGMIEVLAIDDCKLSIYGDYFETLIWVTSRGAELAAKLPSLLTVDSIQVHQLPDRELIQVKAQGFVSEESIKQLRTTFEIQEVKRLAPVLPVLSQRETKVPFQSCAEMLTYDAGRQIPLWKLACEYEMARGNLTEAEVLAKMLNIVQILRRSIQQGIAGTEYEDRVLGYQSGKFQQLMQANRLLNGGVLNRIVLYVTALMK